MLVAVDFILRHKFENTDAPDELASIVSEYLVADVPLHEYVAWACVKSNSKSVELLDFVWDRGLRDANSSRWSVARQLHVNRHYFEWEFHRIMWQASRQGDVAVVQWALEHFPGYPIHEDEVFQAAGNNHLELLELFESQQPGRDITWSTASLDAASKEGHWDVVRWLDERIGTPKTRKANTVAIGCAIKRNQPERMQWLVERGFGVPKYASLAVTDPDNWKAQSQIVRFLVEGAHTRLYYFSCGLKAASVAGDLEFVQWMVLNYVSEFGELTTKLEFPNLDCLGILTTASCNVHSTPTKLEFSKETFTASLTAASSNGHFPVVLWLVEYMTVRGCQEAPAEAARAAAKNGNLTVVQWLYQRFRGYPSVDIFQSGWDSSQDDSLICNAAAINGHLDVVSYLHQVTLELQNKETTVHRSRDLRFTYKAIDGAAANGHLEVLQWLHDHHVAKHCTSDAMDGVAAMNWPCPHSSGCCCGQPSESFVDKQAAILQHLKDNFAGDCSTKAMDGAARKGNLKVLQWLHENTDAGCTTDAMDTAARNGRLDIVKWLHNNTKVGCTTKAMDEAAHEGHMQMVQWLHENCKEGCSDLALENAARGGNLEMVKWLCQNRSELSPSKEAAMVAAAVRQHVGVAKWLQANYPVENPWDTIQKVDSWRFGGVYTLRIMRWLLPWCSDKDVVKIMNAAVEQQQFDVVLFLHSQRRGNNYNVDDVARNKKSLIREIPYRPECRCMLAWFEENCLFV